MLKGNRTFLRSLEPSDIPILYKWYNDQEVNFWSSGAWPLNTLLSEEQIEERFFPPSHDERRYLILNENQEPIGTVGFREINVPARLATLFIVIGEKNAWGKGYGTDALRVIIDYLFLQWNFRRLSLDTWDGNERALKTYKRLGFQIEGQLRQARFIMGEYHDAIVLGLLRDEYLTLYPKEVGG